MPSTRISTAVPARPMVKPLPGPPSDNVSVESLGTETINGLLANGTRITNIIPPGSVGNEQPLTTTSETWMSEDLHQSVLTKHFDPRSGDMVREMKNITREEPDPSLFQVPPDYAIEEAPALPTPTLRP
jgi:hypothetical protein